MRAHSSQASKPTTGTPAGTWPNARPRIANPRYSCNIAQHRYELTRAMDFPVLLPDQLGPYLKGLRHSQGLTQTQLGQRLGLSQVRIAEIEKAPGRIRVDQLLQVLAALRTRVVLQDPRPKPPPQTIAPPSIAPAQQTPSTGDVQSPLPPLPPNKGEW